MDLQTNLEFRRMERRIAFLEKQLEKIIEREDRMLNILSKLTGVVHK